MVSWGPLRHSRITSTGSSTSPQISRCEGVVVRANPIHQPLASWATWRTFPCIFRKPSKKDTNLAPKDLMNWCVVPKSGYIRYIGIHVGTT